MQGRIRDLLEIKKEMLKQEQEYFKTMVSQEINNTCFEKNAISVLTTLEELKTEIRLLESFAVWGDVNE